MRNKPEKKTGRLKKFIVTICVLIFAAFVSAAVFIYAELSKIKSYDPKATVAPRDETFETLSPGEDGGRGDFGINAKVMEPEDVIWPDSVEPITSADVINILLIGQDRREGEPRQRSDTMILFSYGLKDHKVKLISLMRDMYVRIPGYSDNRINAAYAFGGMELLDSTIETNFGVRPVGNIEVDFEGFINIIDLLGGVDIEITGEEAHSMNYDHGWSLTAGVNHMDGEQALAYSRIRKVGNDDYERTERQRTVLTQVINKVLSLDTREELRLLDEMLPYLTTDLSKQDILNYAYTVLTGGIDGIEQYRIPADGTFSPAIIRGMAVLVPDLVETRRLLEEYITCTE
ncbi:MAG: LCP family protein [Oscillospiraceae bacterium]|jgi:LCP family protein required for cell wall assembly